MERIINSRPDHEQPLPDDLSRKLAGWASVARQYPIFGKTWFAYRMRSFVTPLGLLALLLALIGIVVPYRAGGASLYIGLAAVWLVVALGVSLGRALAVLVCRQQWAAAHQVTAVAAALLIGMAVPLSLSPWLNATSVPLGILLMKPSTPLLPLLTLALCNWLV